MLNLNGGFWTSTTVAPGSGGFQCQLVVLCEMEADDVGTEFSLNIDAQGPSGQRWTPAQSTDFTVEGPMLFLCMSTFLPVEPAADATSTPSASTASTSGWTFHSDPRDAGPDAALVPENTRTRRPPTRLPEGQPVMTT